MMEEFGLDDFYRWLKSYNVGIYDFIRSHASDNNIYEMLDIDYSYKGDYIMYKKYIEDNTDELTFRFLL